MPTSAIIRTLGVLVAVLLLGTGQSMGATGDAEPSPGSDRSLTGKLLVASAQMTDPRFARSVLYMVEHNDTGAFGLIVNKVIGTGTFAKLLEGFGVDPAGATGSSRLHYGGPVEMNRVYILHRDRISGAVIMSPDVRFLRRLARGEETGPALIVLGYAGWGPGQLEGEIARGDWLSAPAEDSLIFGEDDAGKWDQAIKAAGQPL